jgi:hypothetical protein
VSVFIGTFSMERKDVEKKYKVSPPEMSSPRPKLYQSVVLLAQNIQKPVEPGPDKEPAQSQSEPAKQPAEAGSPSKGSGWIPVRSDNAPPDLPEKPTW